jgi:hypothetical protein
MTENYILEEQADQREQLRQLFSLVSTLVDVIKTVVKTVGQYSGNNSTDELTANDPKGCPTEKKKNKKVELDGLPLEQE